MARKFIPSEFKARQAFTTISAGILLSNGRGGDALLAAQAPRRVRVAAPIQLCNTKIPIPA